MTNILDHVIAALCELLDLPDGGTITVDTRLDDDLGIDSGLLLELFMLIEERIPEVAVDPAGLKPQQLATVGSFTALIEGGLKAREPA
ncbi:acyl carrier protein [Azospirillum sp. A23]|uniref:acyl carrier protein n=1 Tax=Azospirillum sp. A23 TaxID=3160608 RepID=UPI0036F28496